MTVLAVSRRPYLKRTHMESAARFGEVVYQEHVTGTYAENVRAAMARASDPFVIKVDDHDTYPDNYGELVEYWEPGVSVWGEVTEVGCDGTSIGRRYSMCATVFASDLVLEPDHLGMLSGSLFNQTRMVFVPSGVVKRFCPFEWSWGSMPGTHRSIVCNH